jgi:hypothetical protein
MKELQETLPTSKAKPNSKRKATTQEETEEKKLVQKEEGEAAEAPTKLWAKPTRLLNQLMSFIIGRYPSQCTENSCRVIAGLK